MRKSNKYKKKGSGLKVFLLVGLALVLFTAGFGYMYLNSLLNSTEKEKISQKDDDLGIGTGTTQDPASGDTIYYYKGVKGITNVAVFGVDAEQGTAGRSDVIMIVTIDENTKKIKLSSIVRDTYVDIPGKKMDKVAHAYAYGGAQLALKTLNSNFNLDIKDFMAVNFTSLPQLVEIVGGVPVKVTNAEAGEIPGLTGGGTYTLDGEQALAYSRIRKIDNDFERSRRQRTVMEALLGKMLKQPVSNYPGLMKRFLPLVKTNMDGTDMLGLGTKVATQGIRTIEQNRFPQDSLAKGQKIGGTYFYVFEKEPTLKNIGSYIYLDKKID